jgi:hypothetical protein
MQPGDEVLDLDDRIVRPGSRAEVVRGRLVLIPPAEEPQALCHTRTDYVIRAHVVPPYTVSRRLLTRTSHSSDLAPDVSVYRRDANTGKRLIAEVTFEILGTLPLSDVTDKARELRARGTRRIFALSVERVRALEWSAEFDDWALLPADAELDDPCFARPVPTAALFDAARADAAVVAALAARAVPELRAIEARGHAAGLRKGIIDLCAVLGIELDTAALGNLDTLDVEGLEQMGDTIRATRRWPG